MYATVNIDAIGCSNCRDFVLSKLLIVAGISNIEIDVETKILSFSYKSHNAMEGLRLYLQEIGYPITKDSSLIINKDVVINDYYEDELV
ncbi:heavy-metal-associated domain-containing protein [uncultured Algibacter sp.]|uniref:heavy-metal-associated domain-containing protein n=1 Tax=uncultured Algibacter sp. TaxID=298659 RepID=UPI002613D314|nr:heavy-metal-associated domain-containing protein [uncultured Algibacter sp.]